MRHNYVSQPRVQVPGVGGEDAWGQAVTTHDQPDAPLPGVPRICMYIDAGTYLQGSAGLMQVNTPTIAVAFDDPLQVGDQVTSVIDPATDREFLKSPAIVEMFSDVASAGPMLYRIAALRYAEVE